MGGRGRVVTHLRLLFLKEVKEMSVGSFRDESSQRWK